MGRGWRKTAGTAIASTLGMNSRANRLAKPRASRTPPSAFRPVAVSEVDVVEVFEVHEELPRFASMPDAPPHAFAPSGYAAMDYDYDDAFEVTQHQKGARDNSFDATLRRPDRAQKVKRMEGARANRLFDAPFAHQVATTPPATFTARPVAPLARARHVAHVPPAAPSSTGASLVPVSYSADESGHYQANVGGPTVLVRRASLTNEAGRGVPGWLYAGVAAAVVLAGSLFALGGRGTALQAAGAARVEAPAEQLQSAPVAQVLQQPAAPVAQPLQPAVMPVAAKPAVVDPVLAAALAAPAQLPVAQAPTQLPVAQAPTVADTLPPSKPAVAPRFASSRGVHAVHAPSQPAQAPAPVQVRPPRPMPAPAPLAAAQAPSEGGHDVRSSQQTSAAASKVIGDSL